MMVITITSTNGMIKEEKICEVVTLENNFLKIIDDYFEKNKPLTLRQRLEQSDDLSVETVLEIVKGWLPKEDPRPSYATMQWDKCVRSLHERLEWTMINQTEFLDKLSSEVEQLKEAHELLISVYIEIGPYRDREVKDETWEKVRNFFKFGDSE